MKSILIFIVCCLLLGPMLRAQGPPADSIGNAKAQGNSSAWQLIGLDKAAHFASFHHPVKVAIIDDGFDIDNPLWAANIAHNKSDIPGNNLDDDHNGKIDDYEGWDFGDNDEDVRPAKNMVDKESHGTRVLGVFWQVLEELSAGGLQGITILPIKAVSDGHLNNYLKEGYNGIEYALDQKADVIICSWSGPVISAEEKAILARAQARGTMIIASAGNFYSLEPLYPGAFPPVINVAATNDEGKKLPVSNYGNFVDLSAPGDSLTTYDPYGHTPTAHLSATSAATPVVAAVVVALRAAWPGLSQAAIERLLKNTATPLESVNPLYAGGLGAGMLNIAAIRDALASAQGKEPRTSTPNGPPTSPPTGATPAHPQVQGFVDLRKLQATTPLRIVPTGKYPAIKFMLQAPTAGASTALPNVRMTLYRDGRSRDTLLKGSNMRFPFLAIADSIYLYNATHSTPVQKGETWWYYSAMTIDSSTFYCGSTINITANGEGVLEDGSGNANYTGRNDCKWQLTAPQGKKLQLSFEQFDTEPKIDQVYIFSGTSTKDPILAIFSGHKLPPVIKSWNEQVLIWFITNEENNFQGWRLHYKVVD